MVENLADFVAGTPGRFVPEEMRGQLVEAEHIARYSWAATWAPGRRALDAGCGVGYGATLLADAGAAEVAAVDVAAAVVEAARERVGDSVDVEVADVRELPFPDNAFDLVVCFEVIEHISEQDRALDELVRVLAPGGVLLVSSPNRERYPAGNPHHVREYLPSELEAAIAARLAHVRLLRQQNYLASTLLDDHGAQAEGGSALEGLPVQKLVAKRPGEEVYTVAVGSDEPLPPAPGLALLADPIEVRQWLERFEEQQRILTGQADLLTELEARDTDRADLLEQLAEAERLLAERGEIDAELEMADRHRRRLAEEVGELRERVARGDMVLRDMQASISWRLTKPLRAAKRLLR